MKSPVKLKSATLVCRILNIAESWIVHKAEVRDGLADLAIN